MTEQTREWFKPSEIAEKGMIISPTGRDNYRYVLRQIKQGTLKAKEWTRQGDRAYFMVHVDEIKRFNEDLKK